MPPPFTPSDIRQLEARGISVAEAERQLALLANPPRPIVLDRPCTVGDGIMRITAEQGRELLKLHADAADQGRVSLFIPASGAASRMFRDLLACRADAGLATPAALDQAARAGREEARATLEFLRGLDRFAFFTELRSAVEHAGVPLRLLVREGPLAPVFEAVLGPRGLDLARRPKGLIPFHDYPEGPRSPLEEHLLESTQIAADSYTRARLHFTVSPEHRAAFEARAESGITSMSQRTDARFEVTFSEQHPSTDTIAADPAGGPFRDAHGQLLFRPAGHGALIENLGAVNGDLVMVKNVDNVAHDRWKNDSFRWSRVLIGLAAQVERRAVDLLQRLERGDAGAIDEGARFLADMFHLEPLPRADWLLRHLARPIRVCGMVLNTGEPGGGPMWVRGADGEVTRQIVELSQVADDPGQQEIVARATHFNPVFMALALRDAHDRVYPLEDFVDASSGMITTKSHEGRDLLALERPGLWNGAMAGWNTVFVEVPLGVFNPVKTVNDLLRREHQPGA